MTYFIEVWDVSVPDRYNGLSQADVPIHQQRVDVVYATDTVTGSKRYALDRKAQLWARGQSARVVDYLGYRVEE